MAYILTASYCRLEVTNQYIIVFLSVNIFENYKVSAEGNTVPKKIRACRTSVGACTCTVARLSLTDYELRAEESGPRTEAVRGC